MCTLSHPAVFVNVWVYVPVVVMIWPFQSYVSQVSITDVPCIVSVIVTIIESFNDGHGVFPSRFNISVIGLFPISIEDGVYTGLIMFGSLNPKVPFVELIQFTAL